MSVANVNLLAGILLLTWMGQCAAEHRTVPLDDDVRLDVGVSDTSVEVTTHDKRILLLDAADLSGISVDNQGGVLTIQATERAPRRLRLTVHPEIQLSISGTDSEIRVKGIHGPVSVRNQTQAITMEDIRGPVEVFSYTGPIEIRGIDGEIQAESNTNAVKVRDVTGDVNARSTSSSVTLKNGNSTVVDLQSISGIVSYEGEIPRHARYRLGTHSGEVRLRIPVASDATILLRGRTRTFAVRGAQLEMGDDDVGRIRLGDGRGRIALESVLGTIRVSVRESPADSPPNSPEN